MLCPRGRVLEIGGDKCEIADLLHKKGFEVWVVDIFDQFGGGAQTYEGVRKRFPDIVFRQGFFHEANDIPEDYFDAIYSCSVLEHTPIPLIKPTVERIMKCLKVGGKSVHAVDFTADCPTPAGFEHLGLEDVLQYDNVEDFMRAKGMKAFFAVLKAFHIRHLDDLLKYHGMPENSQQLAERALADVEAFYMGPQGHHMWRSALKLSYDDYPYRKLTSMNFVAERPG